ncbi:WD40 repeat domain-containing protein [uncultured Corynebacterium sp.]|uniref:WD40 repeat domain-containing protein n=1 Tax=uncultured Corynebacterium sp. TaxID=159447 RepID=UPI00288AE5F1|nr:WD40 repeat domain-containing protein [uncultured Corynebacterium sp.]
MIVRRTASRFTAALCLSAVLPLALAACSASPNAKIEEAGGDAAANMGSAEPAQSPASENPAGRVVQFEAVRDLDTTNGVVGVRTENALLIGSIDDIANGKAEEHPLDASCGDVSASDGSFAVACDGAVNVFGQAAQTISTDLPVTSATVVSSGEVLAASDTERKVWVFKDGELSDTIDVARETDQLQAVALDGQDDAVVRISSFDTTIQDIDWQGSRQGGTLRVGLGVGKVAAGEHGLVLAADSTGNQIHVYTTDDIIRLQQSAPVPEGPWDVAWDSSQRLAWVSSLAENTATGYDISQGVPVEKKSFATVANAQSIISLDDGTVVLASATGDGIQIVAPDEQIN